MIRCVERVGCRGVLKCGLSGCTDRMLKWVCNWFLRGYEENES